MHKIKLFTLLALFSLFTSTSIVYSNPARDSTQLQTSTQPRNRNVTEQEKNWFGIHNFQIHHTQVDTPIRYIEGDTPETRWFRPEVRQQGLAYYLNTGVILGINSEGHAFNIHYNADQSGVGSLVCLNPGNRNPIHPAQTPQKLLTDTLLYQTIGHVLVGGGDEESRARSLLYLRASLVWQRHALQRLETYFEPNGRARIDFFRSRWLATRTFQDNSPIELFYILPEHTADLEGVVFHQNIGRIDLNNRKVVCIYSD